jgi:hypothetical protein
VSTAPHLASPICTHERRPGTTVCLLCRQEARLAAADRRKKWILRGTAVGIVIAVVAIGFSSASFLRGRPAAKQKEAAAAAAAAGDSSAAAESIRPQGDAAAAAVSGTAAVEPAPPAGFVPVIRVGETSLQYGVTAVRSDSGIVVLFDTPELRTRMPEKFERFLRWSLPQLYGAQVDSLLARIPLGRLVAQGNLLYELPTLGIHTPIDSVWHLDIYPEIRPGQDGPLVVRYRASVSKD